MSIHKFVDNLSMNLSSTVAKNFRYFSKDTNPKPISELFDLIKIDDIRINGEGYYPIDVRCDNKSEKAGFRVEKWIGYDYPTIIYHHGAAEGSYDFSFNQTLAKSKGGIKANLIAVQALYSTSNQAFMENVAYLSNYTRMLASSVLLVEGLIKHIKNEGSSKVVVTGISLGGFVTNLHFTYFNTADFYRPMLAGARTGDALLDSAYSKMMASDAIAVADDIKQVLNFHDDFAKREQDKMLCLLGEHDQIVKYDIQSQDFDTEQIKVMPFGHATGATKFKVLREHILKSIIE